VARLALRYTVLAIAILVLNFALPRLLPGDPLDADAAEGLNGAVSTLTVDAREHLRAYYHLDRPLAAQFVAYLGDLTRGDLGWSIARSAPVGALVGERLPWTLALVLVSVLIATVGGVLLGLLAAWRGGRTDGAIVSVASALAAIPEFLVAMALLLLLSVGLGWFPLQGGHAIFAVEEVGPLGLVRTLADLTWHLALPALTLVLATAAGFVLVARGAVRTVLNEPYLTTARAKGLPERWVALRHAAPNALLPVLTLFGLRLGQVLGGALVVERVFSIPGLGLFAYEAIRARDYPALQAVFLFGSLAVLIVNFGLEVVYRRLEPRRGVATHHGA
jgi:peptide/nickel transport system permease protein